MKATISQELIFFFSSLITGAVIVFIYDFLRIGRKVIKHAWPLIALEDIIYWIFSALAIFAMIYEKNNGAIRGYSIVGILLGIILYSFTVSTAFVKGVSFVLLKILEIIWKILRFILTPFRFILKKMGKIVKYFIKRLKKMIKEVKISLLRH